VSSVVIKEKIQASFYRKYFIFSMDG